MQHVVAERQNANLVKQLQNQLKQLQMASFGSPPTAQLSVSSTPQGKSPSASPRKKNREQTTAPSEQVLQQDLEVLGIRLGEAQERNFQLEEKVKYLTDLVNELNSELEARSKLIRQLSTQIKVSGRTTADMDKYKLERAQRQNSLMGSLFSPTKKDSLVEEVNAKMSSVLEDTLIKNMQLQEDLKVMGAEVDRLLRENEALKRQLQEYTKINTNTNNSTQNTV